MKNGKKKLGKLKKLAKGSSVINDKGQKQIKGGAATGASIIIERDLCW